MFLIKVPLPDSAGQVVLTISADVDSDDSETDYSQLEYKLERVIGGHVQGCMRRAGIKLKVVAD